jgi:hypothetical protein
VYHDGVGVADGGLGVADIGGGAGLADPVTDALADGAGVGPLAVCVVEDGEPDSSLVTDRSVMGAYSALTLLWPLALDATYSPTRVALAGVSGPTSIVSVALALGPREGTFHTSSDCDAGCTCGLEGQWSGREATGASGASRSTVPVVALTHRMAARPRRLSVPVSSRYTGCSRTVTPVAAGPFLIVITAPSGGPWALGDPDAAGRRGGADEVSGRDGGASTPTAPAGPPGPTAGSTLTGLPESGGRGSSPLLISARDWPPVAVFTSRTASVGSAGAGEPSWLEPELVAWLGCAGRCTAIHSDPPGASVLRGHEIAASVALQASPLLGVTATAGALGFCLYVKTGATGVDP